MFFFFVTRHTATRKNRLEGLRKGKAASTTDPQQQQKRDNALNNARGDAQQKGNKSVYRKGRRGVSRNKRQREDDSDGGTGGTIDTSIAFVCINRLAEEFNTEESIKTFYRFVLVRLRIPVFCREK